MSTSTTLLKELVRQRHLSYDAFRYEYLKTARSIAPDLDAPSRAQFYRWISGQLKGGAPYPDACRVLESMFPPWSASDLVGPYSPGRLAPPAASPAAGSFLTAAPSFPASALAGHWVTCYQFRHDGVLHHHADVACITAESDRLIRAANHPPAPRTEGRAVPFRNIMEAELAGRHLIGHWRNTSDTRYFGALQLAVLPGEHMLDGYYTGVGSDIAVSSGRWRWVRLESADGDELRDLALCEPAAVYDVVMNRSQTDAPLTPAAVREEA